MRIPLSIALCLVLAASSAGTTPFVTERVAWGQDALVRADPQSAPVENSGGALFEAPAAEAAAELILPKNGQPGFLQMPNGERYSIIAGTMLDSGCEACESQSASAAPSGSGGAASAAGGQQDNGTNPAQNTTTFIASNEYYELDGGNQINTSYARFKYPIYDRRGSFLLEVPLVFYDFTATNPNLPELGGLGDIKFQLNYNTCISENKKLTMVNFLELYVPSADTAVVDAQPGGNELTAFNLGTGKYVLGPGMGFVYAIKPNFIFAPLYFYETSVAGDNDRVAIRRGKWRIFAMYALESGAYTLPELQILTNYRTGNNDAYFAPEFGYSKKRTILYVKSGFGISPDVNDRQWGIECGARVQF